MVKIRFSRQGAGRPRAARSPFQGYGTWVFAYPGLRLGFTTGSGLESEQPTADAETWLPQHAGPRNKNGKTFSPAHRDVSTTPGRGSRRAVANVRLQLGGSLALPAKVRVTSSQGMIHKHQLAYTDRPASALWISARSFSESEARASTRDNRPARCPSSSIP